MALTLDATVGGATANSYCTLAEAQAVADEVYPVSETAGWHEGGDGLRHRALVLATRLMESWRWKGDRATSTQALALPRTDLPTPEGLSIYDSDEIPAAVKRAQARLAIWLRQQDASGRLGSGMAEGAGVASVSYGSELSMTFEAGSTQVSDLDRFVDQVVRPLVAGLVWAAQPRMVRG